MRIFRNTSFAMLWSGQLLSNVGNWLMIVAVPVFVYTLTGSVLNASLAFVAETLPAVLLAPLAGVLVDRWRRRAVMIVSDLLRTVVILALLVVDRPGLVWIVFVTLFVENTIGLMFGPAHRALLVTVVGRGPELEAANSWYTISAGVVRLAAAPLGGALYVLLSFDALVLADAGTYLVSVVFLALMGRVGRRAASSAEPASPAEPGPPAPEASATEGVWAEMRDGWRFLSGHAALRALLLVDSLFLLANGGLNVLLVPYMVSRLHVGADGIGLLMSALGVGYLVSARVGVWMSRRGQFRWGMAALLGLIAVAFLGLFTIPSFRAALVCIALVGLPGGALLLLIQVQLQRQTPDEMMGRVGSTFGAVEMVGTVIGALVAGALAGGTVGILPVVIAAVIVLAAAGFLAATLLPAALAPVDGTAAPSPDATAPTPTPLPGQKTMPVPTVAADRD